MFDSFHHPRYELYIYSGDLVSPEERWYHSSWLRVILCRLWFYVNSPLEPTALHCVDHKKGTFYVW